MALDGDFPFVADDLERMMGHRELLTERADLRVGARCLGSDRNLNRIPSSGIGGGVGVRGFDGTAHVAEQVYFVRDIQEGIEDPGIGRTMAAEFENLLRDRIAAVNAAG